MKMSRSVRYALISVEHIAKSDEEFVMALKVSKEYKIPLEYLSKIMQYLVKAGILKSKRGPRGGFSLAKKAEDISILDIYEAIEGTLVNKLEMFNHTPKEGSSREFSQKTEAVYDKAVESIRTIFTDARIANLIA